MDDNLNLQEKVLLNAINEANRYNAEQIFDSYSSSSPSQKKAGPLLKQLLILPVGDKCNLACTYCYEVGRRRSITGIMTIDSFTAILKNVLPYVDSRFSIAFHGGEPLLAGKPFFLDALNNLSDIAGGNWVRPIIQTNGTLIDDEWCDIFKEYNFSVGLSLDGPRKINDRNRINFSGQGSYESILRGIEALQRHKTPFGVIVVVDKYHAGQPHAAQHLIRHFNEIGIKSYDVHPAFSLAAGARERNLSPTAFATYMKALFDAWLEEGDMDITINFFNNFFQSMTGRKAAACYFAGACTTILGVQSDGTAIPCTRPFKREFTFGNLSKNSLPEILSSDAFVKFKRLEFKGQNHANSCKWQGLCHGGCPHERIEDGRQNIASKHIYCTCAEAAGGYPAIYQHMHDSVMNLMDGA